MNEILWHAEDQAYILVGPINKHAWNDVALESVNLQYIPVVLWDDGPNDSSTKRLMFKALFFFIIS